MLKKLLECLLVLQALDLLQVRVGRGRKRKAEFNFMLNKINKLFQRKFKLVSINFAIFALFIGLQINLWLFPITAYAAEETNSTFNLKAPDNSDAFASIPKYLEKLISPAQGIAAVVLTLSCIAVGIRLGYSSATGNAQGRSDAIWNLFWIIVAGVVVVNAKAIMGFSASI